MKMVKLYKGLLCLYIALCLVFTGGLTALSADAQVQNESAGLTDVVYDFTKGMTEGEDVMLLTEYDETGIKNINWKYKNKIQASYTIIFYQDTMRVNGSNIHADTSFEIKPPEHGKYRVKMSYSQAFTGTNQNGATSIDVWMAKTYTQAEYEAWKETKGGVNDSEAYYVRTLQTSENRIGTLTYTQQAEEDVLVGEVTIPHNTRDYLLIFRPNTLRTSGTGGAGNGGYHISKVTLEPTGTPITEIYNFKNGLEQNDDIRLLTGYDTEKNTNWFFKNTYQNLNIISHFQGIRIFGSSIYQHAAFQIKPPSVPGWYRMKISYHQAKSSSLTNQNGATSVRVYLTKAYTQAEYEAWKEDKVEPNDTAFWDSVPEDQKNELLTPRKFEDGKTYYTPIYGMERQKNVRAWLYRKDVFERHGLKTPDTLDELYSVAKKLKELYPDSYPICLRNGVKIFNMIGSEWKPYFTYGVYYDFNAQKWSYGATEDTMRDIVEYFLKLRAEGLVPPDFLTINTKTWEELVLTNRGFIMPEYQTRISYFHAAARGINPEFTLGAMLPPKADTPTGQNMISKQNIDPTGYIICNTGNSERIQNAVKIIDWFYSDEGSELMSWGREGETYSVVNGKKQFVSGDSGESINALYGFQTLGTYLRIDPPAADAIAPAEQSDTTDFVLEHTAPYSNPYSWVALDSEQQKIQNDIGVAINTYAEETLSKFLLGQKPLSEWDEFQKELREMGCDRLIEAYAQAYARMWR